MEVEAIADNKNDQERATYTRLIGNNEQCIDASKRDQRKITASLQTLQVDVQRGYRNLARVTEEERREGNQDKKRMHREAEEQEHYFRRQLNLVTEHISDSYTHQRRALTNEQEKLYEQREAIPWA